MNTPDNFGWDLAGACWDGQDMAWDSTAPLPAPRRKRVSTLPVIDTVGYAKGARDLLNTYKTDLTAKGLDPTSTMTALNTKADGLSALNEEQEAMKTALKTKTEAVGAARDELVVAAGGACDMLIAAFGRSSPQGQEATRLRNGATATTARRTPKPATPTP